MNSSSSVTVDPVSSFKLFGIQGRIGPAAVVVLSGKRGRGGGTLSGDKGDNWMTVEKLDPSVRWPVLTTCPEAVTWLEIQANLGLAPRTIEAYARGLADYFAVCKRERIEPLMAERAEIARYVRDLTQRPSRRGANVVALDSGVGLANATLQQRLVAVRLFYDQPSASHAAHPRRDHQRTARARGAVFSREWCAVAQLSGRTPPTQPRSRTAVPLDVSPQSRPAADVVDVVEGCTPHCRTRRC